MTKNDRVWERLFEGYQILDKVARDGMFIMDAANISAVREARLMTRFEYRANIPKIFAEHGLSILPKSRSQYVIGPFNTHADVQTSPKVEVLTAQLPTSIETIDPGNLYSEAAAISCAYNAGIISNLIGEDVRLTVSGRMSTEEFSFYIDSTHVNQPPLFLEVENSQCEIDAGFESEHYFVLLEAKNTPVQDFLIRQLYYPYRLWSDKLRKKVVPVLMTYSHDRDEYDFYIYAFEDEFRYNSLALIGHQRWAIAPEAVGSADVSATFQHVRVSPDLPGIPFPQANDFSRVVDLLSLLVARGMTRDQITSNYVFDARQTQYYTDAARYLGLITKDQDPRRREVTFSLTSEARHLLKQRHKQKQLGLIERILQHKVFYDAFDCAMRGTPPSNAEIVQIMSRSGLNIGGTTLPRRADTVRAWIQWIWSQWDD